MIDREIKLLWLMKLYDTQDLSKIKAMMENQLDELGKKEYEELILDGKQDSHLILMNRLLFINEECERLSKLKDDMEGMILMDYRKAIEVINSNYPPINYTLLREALDLAIKVLQQKVNEEEGDAIKDIESSYTYTRGEDTPTNYFISQLMKKYQTADIFRLRSILADELQVVKIENNFTIIKDFQIVDNECNRLTELKKKKLSEVNIIKAKYPPKNYPISDTIDLIMTIACQEDKDEYTKFMNSIKFITPQHNYDKNEEEATNRIISILMDNYKVDDIFELRDILIREVLGKGSKDNNDILSIKLLKFKIVEQECNRLTILALKDDILK